MKIALVAVLSFAVPFVVTTVYVVKRAPPVEVERDHEADSVALADSLLADSLWHDSILVVQHDDSEEQSDTEIPQRPTLLIPMETPVQQAAGATEANADRQRAFESLARIFGQMKPAEAAEVLAHLTNDEAEGVMRSLSARKAALVLAELPQRRAAELARRLLIPIDGGNE